MADCMLDEGLLAMLSAVAASVFTTPTAGSFLALASGWLLARGRRTTSGMVLAASAQQTKHFSSYHRFFSVARWAEGPLRRALLRVLLGAFCSGGEIVLVGDDTVRAKTGPKIAGAAFWHNHCAAARQQRKTVWGHSYVMLGLRVSFRGKGYCVPVGLMLYRTQADCRQAALRYRSRSEMLMEMVRDVLACAPGRSVLLLVDGQYACQDLLRSLPRGLTVITRLRHDAALWAPPRRPRHRVGRPRMRNGRLPTPTQMAADATRPWQCTAEGRELKSCQALWYRVNRRRVHRVVLIRRRDGKHSFACLLCTDARREDEEIVSSYAARWSIEITIRDAKQQAGLGQGQCRGIRAVQRQAAFTVTMMACLMAWYLTEGHRTDRQAPSPWYLHKAGPSYGDMLAHARRCCWRQVITGKSASDPETHEIPLRLLGLLASAA